MAAFIEGKDIQAFPMFGVERRGAPVVAFTRMDDRPINIKTQIYAPDAIIVLDPSLIGMIDCGAGLKEGGYVMINTKKSPKEFNFGNHRVFTVDATGIAVENHLGTATNPIVNTAILGAYSKIWKNVSMKSIEQTIKDNAPVKTTENIKAAKDAFERTVV